jgi:hypothetical protein
MSQYFGYHVRLFSFMINSATSQPDAWTFSEDCTEGHKFCLFFVLLHETTKIGYTLASRGRMFSCKMSFLLAWEPQQCYHLVSNSHSDIRHAAIPHKKKPRDK